MPKSRTPGLQTETRGGKTVRYYFNKATGRRHRIEAVYDTPAFWDEYHALREAAVGGAENPAVVVVESRKTLRWLVKEYRQSTHWLGLSASTRRQRDKIYHNTILTNGNVDYCDITSRDIERGVAKRLNLENEPSRRTKTDGIVAANFFLTCMNALFNWAADQVPPLVEKSPSAKVKKVRRRKTSGHRKWSEAEMEQYRQYWPLGTTQRLAFDILHYTGMRCSDAWRFGPGNVSPDGSIVFTTVKTGTEAYGFVGPGLARSIQAFNRPHADAFLLTRTGEPFANAASLSSAFIGYCRRAGLPSGLSAHGIRKATATAAAEAGATPYELMAMFGWTDLRTPLIYTNSFTRKQAGLKIAQLFAGRDQGPVVAFPAKLPAKRKS